MNHILSNHIFEAKQAGILYHFTDFESLLDILKSGEINISSDRFHDNFISTTRRFDFKWGPCRLSLDGDNISNRYKIAPMHYFNSSHGGFNDDYRASGDIGVGNMVVNTMSANQYEERIFSDKNIKVLPYLLSVDIVLPEDFNDDSQRYGYPPNYSKQNRQIYKRILTLCKKIKVNINTVDAFKPHR